MKTVRVTIHGRVQGVWFRAWTEREARALDLYGWVRNRKGGTVEALFKGRDEAVEKMIALCHEGPKLARVERVDVQPADGIVPDYFEQKPTV